MLSVVVAVADAGSYSSRLPVALALRLADVAPSGASSQDAEHRARHPPLPARRVVEQLARQACAVRDLLVRLALFATCSSGCGAARRFVGGGRPRLRQATTVG